MTVCIALCNRIKYSIQQRLSTYSTSVQLHLTFCTILQSISLCIETCCGNVVVVVRFFYSDSYFTASLELLEDLLWVRFVLACSLGELIQG